MSTDAQPAESSPAPSTPFDLGTLNESEMTEWRLSGKLPEPTTEASAAVDVSSPADSTPAEPVEQAASTDATSEAASEPAAPRKSKADERFEKILRDRATEREGRERAERELVELRARLATQDASTDSSFAPETFPDFDEAWQDANPGKTWTDHQREQSTFYARQTFERLEAEKQQKSASDHFERTARERTDAFKAKYREAVDADSTLPTRISPQLFDAETVDARQKSGNPITPINVIAQEILESPAPVKLMLHLSEHPDELASLQQMSAVGLIRRMTELRLQLDQPAIPPPKTISTAPALTTTLGSRPAVPGDPLKAAEKSGDYLKFRDLANARDMAVLGVK